MDFLLLCIHLHWCHTISISCFPDRILMNMYFPCYSRVNLQLRNKSLPPMERELPYTKGNSFKNFFAVLCWPKPITYVILAKGVDVRYVQPRGYFLLEDHRFDKLPMVGEGQW